MNKLLCKDPKYRLGNADGIKEILEHAWFKGIKLQNVLDRKIEPPYKPSLLKFYLDDQDFKKGEKQYY